MKKTLLIALTLTATLVFAQDGAPAKAGKIRMLEKTGGFVFAPVPDKDPHVAILDNRVAKSPLDLTKATSFPIRKGAPVADKDIVITLCDKGAFSIFPKTRSASVPAGTNDVETLRNITDAVSLISLSAAPMDAQKMAASFAGAEALGLQMARRTTYKRACQEGWAPAPTNEFQKAIWKQVKTATNKPAAK